MKPREGLYTAKQVQELLQLTATQISRLVERGVLTIVSEPGYTHRYYDKASVDEYRSQRTVFEETHKAK